MNMDERYPIGHFEHEDYLSTDIDLSIRLLESLHQRWVILLESMSEEDYQREFYHPESIKTFKLDYNLGIYAWHGKHHVAHITNLRLCWGEHNDG